MSVTDTDHQEPAISKIAKAISVQIHEYEKTGRLIRADRLRICLDLLSEPYYQQPVLPVVPNRAYQNHKRS